jgi:CRISPR-associated protein Csd1
MPPKDDPERDVRAVRALYESVQTGTAPREGSTEFYVLGLAPNAARPAVRYWHRGTTGELAHQIYQHFRDLEIVRAERDQRRLALFCLLVEVGAEGNVDNVPPNVAGAVMRAVLEPGPGVRAGRS